MTDCLYGAALTIAASAAYIAVTAVLWWIPLRRSVRLAVDEHDEVVEH